MVAGEILHERHRLNEADGVYYLRSTLECHEMIAQVKDEEIIGQNAEDN